MLEAEGATVDDGELVRRMAAGERGALEVLYRRHQGWILQRLQRRCSDPDLVDTAVQDTFVDAWRSAGRWKPTGDVGGWLWTIARRRLIDQLRRRPAPVPMMDEQLFDAIAAYEVRGLLADDLAEAFMQLDRELRDVLIVTVFDGYSNKEAGHVLGIPVGTVKSRLARARRELGEALA